MDELKKQIKKRIVSMLNCLECEHYKIEAERFQDICGEAEEILDIIRGSDVIDWEEGL